MFLAAGAVNPDGTFRQWREIVKAMRGGAVERGEDPDAKPTVGFALPR
jgi:hypothetical protein